MTRQSPAAPTAKRRARKPRPDRRAEIAAAAMECLKREGYAALTARKVAAQAGLSLGHLTYAFADMADVLSQAYRAASAELRQATEARLDAAGQDPWARLEGFLQAGFTSAILEPGYLRMRIDLWSAARTAPQIAETERALYEQYRAALLIHLAQIAPEAPADARTAVADAILAMLDGLWLDAARRGNTRALANGLRACLDLARLRLAPGAGVGR